LSNLQEISPGGVDTRTGGGSSLTPEMIAILESGEHPMLKSSNIAQTLLFILMTQYDVNITEIIVKPVGERI